MKQKKSKIEKNKRPVPWAMLLTVKAVIVNKNKEVLLLKRSDNEKTHARNYDLPGGTIEKGETVEEALKREIREETGLLIDNAEIIKVSEYPKEHKKFDEVKSLRYLVSYLKDDFKEIKLNKYEHNEFRWLSFGEAVEMLSGNGFEKEKKETILNAKKYLEMKESLDNWKRCLAEFDNYRKRQEEVKKDTVKYATENIISQILPVIDNFTISVSHIPDKERKSGWVQGIMYIKKQLEDVLKDNGVEKIGIKVGDNFDATLCEAVDDNECNDCKKEKGRFKNRIKKIILPGYKIKNKTIRPARVVVE